MRCTILSTWVCLLFAASVLAQTQEPVGEVLPEDELWLGAAWGEANEDGIESRMLIARTPWVEGRPSPMFRIERRKVSDNEEYWLDMPLENFYLEVDGQLFDMRVFRLDFYTGVWPNSMVEDLINDEAFGSGEPKPVAMFQLSGLDGLRLPVSAGDADVWTLEPFQWHEEGGVESHWYSVQQEPLVMNLQPGRHTLRLCYPQHRDLEAGLLAPVEEAYHFTEPVEIEILPAEESQQDEPLWRDISGLKVCFESIELDAAEGRMLARYQLMNTCEDESISIHIRPEQILVDGVAYSTQSYRGQATSEARLRPGDPQVSEILGMTYLNQALTPGPHTIRLRFKIEPERHGYPEYVTSHAIMIEVPESE